MAWRSVAYRVLCRVMSRPWAPGAAAPRSHLEGSPGLPAPGPGLHALAPGRARPFPERPRVPRGGIREDPEPEGHGQSRRWRLRSEGGRTSPSAAQLPIPVAVRGMPEALIGRTPRV